MYAGPVLGMGPRGGVDSGVWESYCLSQASCPWGQGRGLGGPERVGSVGF